MSDLEDRNFQSMALSEDEESPLQKHENMTMELENLQPSSLPMSKSMSLTLDVELGNTPGIQDTEIKMPLLAFTPTMSSLSQIHGNQSSDIPETDTVVKLLLQEVESQNPSHMSSSNVLPNKENVGRNNSSQTSVSQRQTQINNLKPGYGIQLSGQTRMSKFRQYLKIKLMRAPMLPLLSLEDTREKCKRNQSLMCLEVLKFIRKWLEELGEMNKYYTERYQDLIEKIMRLNRLEGIVNERFLNMSCRFFNLDQLKESEKATFVYKSLKLRGESIVHFLTFYKKNLHADFVIFSRIRMAYLDTSIQISKYPFEEKLLEEGESVVSFLNKWSVFLDSKSVKLEEKSAGIDFFSLESEYRVKKFVDDIDMAL